MNPSQLHWEEEVGGVHQVFILGFNELFIENISVCRLLSHWIPNRMSVYVAALLIHILTKDYSKSFCKMDGMAQLWTAVTKQEQRFRKDIGGCDHFPFTWHMVLLLRERNPSCWFSYFSCLYGVIIGSYGRSI